ncbi:MAG: alpha/beta hydrolase [Chitinophagaceae bacterium]
MSYVHTNNNTASPVSLFYEDWGTGKPVVLIHGWPLSHEMWEYQVTELPKHGIRCIAYDRRGFGKSTKTWDGYNYDTLAADLKALLDELDLKNVTLVGFSMGGGEIARYFGLYGSERISKVVLISAVTPFLLKTSDNPGGVDQEIFDKMVDQISEDRADFLVNFGKQFFGASMIQHPVSQAMLDWNQTLALLGSPQATIECARAFSETDFRHDIPKIQVPTLIIHGDNDKTVPIGVSGDLTANMLVNAEYKVYEGAPHGLYYTDKDRLNKDLITFIG